MESKNWLEKESSQYFPNSVQHQAHVQFLTNLLVKVNCSAGVRTRIVTYCLPFNCWSRITPQEQVCFV